MPAGLFMVVAYRGFVFLIALSYLIATIPISGLRDVPKVRGYVQD